MSENGALKHESEEDVTVDGFFDRFLTLAARHRRKSSPMALQPAHVPTPAEKRAAALSGWLADDTATEIFIPWLDELIANARATAQLNHANHAEVIYWLGVEQGLVTLLTELLAIRGQAKKS